MKLISLLDNDQEMVAAVDPSRIVCIKKHKELGIHILFNDGSQFPTQHKLMYDTTKLRNNEFSRLISEWEAI